MCGEKNIHLQVNTHWLGRNLPENSFPVCGQVFVTDDQDRVKQYSCCTGRIAAVMLGWEGGRIEAVMLGWEGGRIEAVMLGGGGK